MRESSPLRFSTMESRFLARFNTLSSLKWLMFSILDICERSIIINMHTAFYINIKWIYVVHTFLNIYRQNQAT